MYNPKFVERKVKLFDDSLPINLYQPLCHIELNIKGERFEAYIKKEDEDRFLKCFLNNPH